MRRIVEDYEAKLRPPPGSPGGSGKAEWERYGNDVVELSARFRGVAAADGRVEVRLDGRTIGSAVTKRGRGALEVSSADGVIVPPVAEGQRVDVFADGVVVLTGVFVAD